MQTKLIAACTLLAGVALTAMGHDAHACINGRELRIDQQVIAVAKAERDADRGQLELAGRGVLQYYPGIKKQRIRSKGLSMRAVRVMARVVVRTKGAFDGGVLFPAKSDAERTANLAWALHVLQTFSRRNPKDSVAKADLAEAFAQFPNRLQEAKQILVALENKDLMASPRGYATLAKLREQAGEGRPAFIAHPLETLQRGRIVVARARCEAMGGKKEMCGPEGEET